ncbi:hypothetical protein EJ05DRAFT_120162 [Pseudovirgaria hyperparasitica]|uniref:MARVEL domain-containing protein n=1 Tax=Pseudovirgaria hyperparasitica TaxID=470096 RepID=A0A6A6VYX4_9PEZI|nr:uncharacterized protein EJ05DRAFT_120162 [Pseudovirgaria hyperparasitica]KAF2755046.1 hypothetical protein EJ05DRAFT_120162 [Pseudovirgaria hyperparasitica]
MSISGLSFWFWRFCEILTLIPTLGMMAYFVNLFVSQNILTPDYILVLFITSVLATAWAIATIILYAKARHSAFLVAMVDLGFVGCFIAGVYLLRFIAGANCTSWEDTNFSFSVGDVTVTGPGGYFNTDKNCAMLKASFAFGIMNCIMFFFTFFLALFVHRHHRGETTIVRERHVSRHSHRRSRDYDRSPRRSHHSSRRTYV